MRVIAGEARGMRLKTVEGMDTRPTADRVKEAICSILQFDLPGARVLDLYAGSGQMGIEALSRGADYAVLNDQDRAAQQIIKDNLVSTGLFKKSRVLSMDAEAYLDSTKEIFDIVFLDPPYQKGILPKILPNIEKIMSKNGIIVCEHEKNEEIPKEISLFHLKKQYRYGKIMVSTYTVPKTEE